MEKIKSVQIKCPFLIGKVITEAKEKAKVATETRIARVHS